MCLCVSNECVNVPPYVMPPPANYARARVQNRACPGHPESILELAVLLCLSAVHHLCRVSTSAWPERRSAVQLSCDGQPPPCPIACAVQLLVAESHSGSPSIRRPVAASCLCTVLWHCLPRRPQSASHGCRIMPLRRPFASAVPFTTATAVLRLLPPALLRPILNRCCRLNLRRHLRTTPLPLPASHSGSLSPGLPPRHVAVPHLLRPGAVSPRTEDSSPAEGGSPVCPARRHNLPACS